MFGLFARIVYSLRRRPLFCLSHYRLRYISRGQCLVKVLKSLLRLNLLSLAAFSNDW